MRNVLIGGSVLGLFALVGWMVFELRAPIEAKAPVVTAAEPAQVARAAQPLPGQVPTVAAAPGVAAPTEELAPKKLAANDDKLRARVDEVIPAHMVAEAAPCYRGGLNKSQHIDFTYRLHVADGDVTISDLKIEDDTIKDRTMARCIETKLAKAKFHDDELPDYDGEGDVFLNSDAFKRYLAEADNGEGAPIANN
jgi:hypothetical protein